MGYVLEPPAIYQQMLPYRGRLHVYEFPAAQVEAVCRAFGAKGADVMACAIVGPHDCWEYLPIVGRGGVGRLTRDALKRHEDVHCVCPGWHDNPPSCERPQ
jgi:hypothetical protein